MRLARAVEIAAVALMAACGSWKPEPIAYDADGCGYCRMQISDPRFGAELITRRGRAVKFDSIECLLTFYKQAASANDVRSVWVSDFRHPGTFIDATQAHFVDLGAGRAPMGRGFAALGSAESASELVSDRKAIKRWSELL